MPINFEGATEIHKPENMTDEECSSAFALIHKNDKEEVIGFTTCWKPSYEDMQAFARGEGVFIHVPYQRLVVMALYTVDENGKANV